MFMTIRNRDKKENFNLGEEEKEYLKEIKNYFKQKYNLKSIIRNKNILFIQFNQDISLLNPLNPKRLIELLTYFIKDLSYSNIEYNFSYEKEKSILKIDLSTSEIEELKILFLKTF